MGFLRNKGMVTQLVLIAVLIGMILLTQEIIYNPALLPSCDAVLDGFEEFVSDTSTY